MLSYLQHFSHLENTFHMFENYSINIQPYTFQVKG